MKKREKGKEGTLFPLDTRDKRGERRGGGGRLKDQPNSFRKTEKGPPLLLEWERQRTFQQRKEKRLSLDNKLFPLLFLSLSSASGEWEEGDLLLLLLFRPPFPPFGVYFELSLFFFPFIISHFFFFSLLGSNFSWKKIAKEEEETPEMKGKGIRQHFPKIARTFKNCVSH